MLEHWLWLAHRTGINEHVKYDLVQHFGTADAVFDAKPEDFLEVGGLTADGMEALADHDLGPCERILDICERDHIQVLTIQDAEYPQRLKNIYDPPLVLYYKGTLPDFDALPVVGIVGTRKASAYGETVARRLGKEISGHGGLVISGLAAGIDAAAMNGAILAGGSPVGVLGCGVDVIYPRSNKALFAATAQYGCILSEFMPGEEPLRWHFPKRNRIISGLSCGVVVVEAPERSGSLNTARHALDQGRDVFAVPGNVDVESFMGSNQLLREGAGTVLCGWDVMSEYLSRFPDKIRKTPAPIPESVPTVESKVAQTPSVPKKKAEPKAKSEKKDIDKRPSEPYIDIKSKLQGLSEQEKAIVTALCSGERLVDDVIAETGLSSAKVLGALTMLEIRKIIVRLPGKRIALREQ